MNKYQLYSIGGALLAAVSLGGCSSMADAVKALSQDQSAVSVHQQITAPGYSVVVDVSRAQGSTTAVSASSNGATVNNPPAVAK